MMATGDQGASMPLIGAVGGLFVADCRTFSIEGTLAIPLP
jgi:hypothetical protein